MYREFKLLLVGDSATGKTSWVNSLRSLLGDRSNIPTLDVIENNLYKMTVSTNTSFKFWDTSGTPRFGSYTPTLGVEVHPITLPATTGCKNTIFKIWDTAGTPRFGGFVRDAYCAESNCAIILQTHSSSVNTPYYISAIRKCCSDIPILIVDSSSLSHSTLLDPLYSLNKLLSL